MASSSSSQSRRRQTNVQEAQNYLLIWLDSNIDEKNKDCQNTMTQLQRVINDINTFTNGDECIKFLDNMDNDKAFMIISGSFGQNIVPRIHDMSQVESIFIFCGNKQRHEQWAKEWSKIKGVYTEIKPLCQSLEEVTQQCAQNTSSISFIKKSDDISYKNLDQMDSLFMYTLILKEILLSIEFEQKYIIEFTNYCRTIYSDNSAELKIIDELETHYHEHRPVWWYSRESFLYVTMNRALRLMDVDIIIKTGFFICDLHRHIAELHKKQFSETHSKENFFVYRGQQISKEDFERMEQKPGGLISFHSFLSTQNQRDISLQFARYALKNSNSMGILFVMKIDPSITTVPFANIRDASYFNQEDEVLFSMNTVFRLCSIEPMDDSQRLFQIQLVLTNDQDPQLDAVTHYFREEICRHPNSWYQLGLFLLKVKQFDKAQELYELLLAETPDLREKGTLYHQIGLVKSDQGKYEEAISFYEKALDICQKTLPPNHPHLASAYSNIGVVYEKNGEYSKALTSYEKALKIYQKIRPPHHPDMSLTCNNLGSVYCQLNEPSKALSYHEKALDIRQQTLPPSHPDIGTSYNSIGVVYYKMDEYVKALSYYEKALEMRQRSLPPNHLDLASTYNNIGLVYKSMDEYSKGLSFHERAVNIGQISLPTDHPDLQMYKKNCDEVKKKL